MTYGDAAPRKRRQLSRLAPRDLLVFYCGLRPHPREDAARLFLIGYLQVKKVYRLQAGDLKADRALRQRFGGTAHFLRRRPDPEFVLVEGYRNKSKLFNRALPFSNRSGELLHDLAPFGYQGSVQRAVGHWVRGDAALASLEAWLRHGPASLVKSNTRLFGVDLLWFGG